MKILIWLLVLSVSSIHKYNNKTFENLYVHLTKQIYLFISISVISGYVKTKFNISRNKNGITRGIGAITNGSYKLSVQIKDFTESSLEIGDYVTIEGTVKNTG